MKLLNYLKQLEIDEKYKKKRYRVKKNKSSVYSKIFKFLFFSTSGRILSISMLLVIPSILFLWINGKNLMSFILVILVYLIYIIFSIYRTYKNTQKLRKHLFLPFNSAINANIKRNYYFDKKYLKKLIDCDIAQLRIAELELNNEYTFLNKRLYLMIGPIDKIGILPALISTISLTPSADGFFASNWLYIIVYSYILFFPISLFFYALLARYERMISLIKLAIKSKDINDN